MRSLKRQFIRFLRFLKGTDVQDDRTQVKRFITILGLATLFGLLLSPLAILITLPRANGSAVSGGSLPTVAPSSSGSSPTPVPGAPVKGLSDNPAYQWWVRPNAPEPDSWWGANQNAQTLSKQISLMQELGVKLFRLGVAWVFIAPNRPGGNVYNSAQARDPNWSGYDWTRWDMIVQLATAANIQLVPVIDFTPPWASGVATTTSSGPDVPPQSAQYFGDFMFALATRYKGQIHYWELWNEEDDSLQSWTGTMTQYVQLILKPGYEAVKQVDPTAQVVLGGLAGDTHMGSIYAAGGGPYFDIGNFHAYYSAAVGDSTALDHVRGAMNANGDRTKPIWLTEFGWPTHTATKPSDGVVVTPANSNELAQSKLISGVFGMKVQAIFFYQLHDTGVYDTNGTLIKQVYWGLVSQDFSHLKLGFEAYKNAANGALPGAELTFYSAPDSPSVPEDRTNAQGKSAWLEDRSWICVA